MTKRISCCLLLAVSASILGCGKGKGTPEASATVTGKVTLNGKPLPGGTINFRSTTTASRLGSGQIQADGTYTAKEVPQGPCKVFIDNSALKPMDANSGYKPPEAAAPLPGTKYVPIPSKYTSEASSDLTTTVAGDPFTYDVDLK